MLARVWRPIQPFFVAASLELRFLRIAGQGEIFVNGRRVLYAPVNPKNTDLGFIMKVVGMTVEIKDFHLNELLPAK